MSCRNRLPNCCVPPANDIIQELTCVANSSMGVPAAADRNAGGYCLNIAWDSSSCSDATSVSRDVQALPVRVRSLARSTDNLRARPCRLSLAVMSTAGV